jgi:hypothetical protein
MRMPDSLLSGTRAVADREGNSHYPRCMVSPIRPNGWTCATKVRTGKAVAHDCPLSAEHTSPRVPGSVA